MQRRVLARLLPGFVTVAIVVGAAAPPATGQNPYRWVDAQGVVHYSQSPPPANTALAPLPAPPQPPRSPSSSPAPQATASTGASLRTVTASGEHRMGDRDTREEATRMATESAKRNALEQVATYLERVTVVSDAMVSKDEIRTYTAGVILVLEQNVSTRLEADSVVVHVDLTVQVDPDEVVQAIKTLRQNTEASGQILTLQREVDRLQREVDASNVALASATTSDQVQALRQQRQDVLNRMESNALISQAWIDWVIVTPVTAMATRGAAGGGGMASAGGSGGTSIVQVQNLIAQARVLSPNNPRLGFAQQRFGVSPGFMPPRSVPPPSYGQPPARGQSPSYAPPLAPRTPAAPAYQNGTPRLAQAPPGTLPPTLHQLHPQAMPPVPRVPYRVTPPQRTAPQQPPAPRSPQSSSNAPQQRPGPSR